MSYVSEIADSIISHSNGSAILGPEIYTAIAEWEKNEIPVAVVLISIDDVCRQADGCRDKQVPIGMIQEAVSRNFRTWLAHMVGI